MLGYAENHTKDMYKFYNTETKRVIMTWDVKWTDWKMTDPSETLKMFRDAHEEYLVPGIEKDKITTLESEDNISVHVILDDGESVRLNTNSKTSEFTYHKKDTNTETSAYDRVLNELKKIDSSYNTNIPRMKKPVI